jgi:Glyoxalase-like domain
MIMNAPPAELDHLVVAADTLAQGTAYIAGLLGVEPTGGGKHDLLGTHNQVLKLERGRYLEVIAIDPDGRRPDFPRWFNLDDPEHQARLKISPRLVAWVARCDAIDSLAVDIFGQQVRVRSMQRGALKWRFAGTNDGSLPGGGLIPHLIQWDVCEHPTQMMSDSGCRLVALEGAHSEPTSVRTVISRLGLDRTIAVHAASNRRPQGLRARIKTPQGIVVLD